MAVSKEGNEHMWRQFIRLGDMIGDGLHHEEPWISKEYKQLAKILCPPTEEEKAFMKGRRQQNKAIIDEQMTNLLKDRKCTCGGDIKQARSGSKVAYCQKCKQRFKAKSKPTKQ
jgi:hypothetical protein